MICAKIKYCLIYKKNELVLIYDYLYDKNYNITNILFDDATLRELVRGYFVKTIDNYFLLLRNVLPIIDQKDLRLIKLKKLKQCIVK